jgi:superfamily II DNA or RNA helicase
MILSRCGLIVPYDAVTSEVREDIKKRVLMESENKYGVVKRKNYSVKKISNKIYYVFPRFIIHKYNWLCKEVDNCGENNIVYSNSIYRKKSNRLDDLIENECFPRFFNESQKIVVNHIMSNQFEETNMKRGRAGAVICMNTGTGKTETAIKLIGLIKRRTLVVVHNKKSKPQWIAKINKYLSRSSSPLVVSDNPDTADICVMIINSASKKLTEAQALRFDFGVFDECHGYGGAEFSKIFWKAQCPYMLGLTATPKEIPVFNEIIFQHIGDVLYAYDLPGFIDTSREFNVDVTIITYRAPTYQIAYNKNRVVSSCETRKLYAADEQRNLLICKLIEYLYTQRDAEGKPTKFPMIFTSECEHLMQIVAAFKEYIKEKENSTSTNSNAVRYFVAPDINKDTAVMMGSTKLDEIQRAINESQVIFGTYSFLGTGISISRVNCEVYASPKKSIIQPLGRMLRYDSDRTIKRYLFDIWDCNSALKNQIEVRKEYYRRDDKTKKAYPIKYVNAKHYLEESSSSSSATSATVPDDFTNEVVAEAAILKEDENGEREDEVITMEDLIDQCFS